jgi:membrane-bound lytic murein transglycosylase D
MAALLAACGGPAVPPQVVLEEGPAFPILADAEAESLIGAIEDEALPEDENLLTKILRTHPSLQELEDLYADGGAQYFEGDLDLSEEYFYLLAERGKLGNFIEILGEERFFSESYAPVSQSLNAAYDSLRAAYGLPDFLLPPEVEASSFEREVLPVDNAKVQAWLRYFTGKGRSTFQRWLDRRGQIGWILESILQEEGLPTDLIYMAMIESGLQPSVRSRASAVGYWQFVRSTARNRGLLVNEWADERRDIEKATRAACRHLQMLHGMFGNWPLALAAYNAGEYRIQRAIGLQGDPDYWELRLPRETREYVPKLIAAARIGKDPEAFGFSINEQDTLRYDTIEVNDTFSLDQIAKAGGFSVRTLQGLNPQLIAGCTPPKHSAYAVRVPVGRGESTLAAVRAIPEHQRITWRKHRVRSGETLGQLARRYRTSVSAIMELNGITNPRRVRAGRQLTIPYPRGVTPSADPVAVARAQPTPPPQAPAGRKTIQYRVRTGDTLSTIAEAHGVSVSSIRRLNGLRSHRIYAGRSLVLHVSEDFDGPGDPFHVDESTHERTEYRVIRGDTLSAIGRRFGVDVAALLAWNDLGSAAVIRPGDRLQIWRPRSR